MPPGIFPNPRFLPKVPPSGRKSLFLQAPSSEMAILLVEQYYDFAEELADDYLMMERGKSIARGLGKDMRADGVRQLVAI